MKSKAILDSLKRLYHPDFKHVEFDGIKRQAIHQMRLLVADHGVQILAGRK